MRHPVYLKNKKRIYLHVSFPRRKETKHLDDLSNSTLLSNEQSMDSKGLQKLRELH